MDAYWATFQNYFKVRITKMYFLYYADRIVAAQSEQKSSLLKVLYNLPKSMHHQLTDSKQLSINYNYLIIIKTTYVRMLLRIHIHIRTYVRIYIENKYIKFS